MTCKGPSGADLRPLITELVAVPPGPKIMAAIFGLSGLVHLLKPGVYEPMVPRQLPARRTLVYLSGIAELGCATGLVTGRRWAGPLGAGILLGVWPANIQMAVDATRSGSPAWRQFLVWGRVPLQIPLIRMVLGRRPTGSKGI